MELEFAVRSMAKGKAHGLEGVVIELFLLHWHVIEGDFFEMIKEPVGLLARMMKGHIALLHKQAKLYKLRNLRPTTN